MSNWVGNYRISDLSGRYNVPWIGANVSCCRECKILNFWIQNSDFIWLESECGTQNTERNVPDFQESVIWEDFSGISKWIFCIYSNRTSNSLHYRKLTEVQSGAIVHERLWIFQKIGWNLIKSEKCKTFISENSLFFW